MRERSINHPNREDVLHNSKLFTLLKKWVGEETKGHEKNRRESI